MASLGKDLARIRKERELSLDDIQAETKIPVRILRSIEDDSIFTDLDENATYIRSYVRGYAKALSIDDRQIIHALDKREKNAYTGSLQKLLEESPESSTTDSHEVEESSLADNQQEDEENDAMIHDHSPEFKSPSTQQSSSDTSSKSSIPRSTSPDRSEIRSVDWADIGQRFRPLKSMRPKTMIGTSLIVIIIAVGSYFLFFNTNNGADNTNQQSTVSQESSVPTTEEESAQLNIVPETTSAANDTAETTIANTAGTNIQQEESLEALPDTLDAIVYAAYGKLEPVRVYTDIMDNINPYWIEQGQAMRFNFVNEIRIRGDYENIVLLMNGHLVENFREQFYNPQTRLVEITRSYFEGNSKWLQPAPDSLAIDAPAPDSIRARPTYN